MGSRSDTVWTYVLAPPSSRARNDWSLRKAVRVCHLYLPCINQRSVKVFVRPI
jgi:hypothetical protein